MRKILTMILAIACLTIGFANLSFAAPTDAEVINAYHAANKIYDLYDKKPLPTDGKAKYEQGYLIYYNVASPTIHSMLDLRNLTETAFTKGFTNKLLATTKVYKSIAGTLYVLPCNRGDHLFAGATTFKVIRNTGNPDAITLQASTAMYSMKNGDVKHTGPIESFEIQNFSYVNTPAGWRFNTFTSVK